MNGLDHWNKVTCRKMEQIPGQERIACPKKKSKTEAIDTKGKLHHILQIVMLFLYAILFIEHVKASENCTKWLTVSCKFMQYFVTLTLY